MIMHASLPHCIPVHIHSCITTYQRGEKEKEKRREREREEKEKRKRREREEKEKRKRREREEKEKRKRKRKKNIPDFPFGYEWHSFVCDVNRSLHNQAFQNPLFV